MDLFSESVKLSCPAKINLALSVGAADPDDPAGRHPIASWMVAVDYSDQLTLQKKEEGESTFDIQFTDPDRSVDWPLEQDLAHRAYQLVQEHMGRQLAISASLSKQIPAGAGVGGGSSNAAGMLVGLKMLYKLRLSNRDLFELATTLGSDVPFAVGVMLGRTSSLVTGFGEKTQTTPVNQKVHMALVFPPFGCPTGQVYQAFDSRNKKSSRIPDEKRVKELASAAVVAPHAPFNDLAEPACDVQPGLGELQSAIAETVQRPVHITGSGSSLFVIGDDQATCQQMCAQISQSHDVPAIATSTL